MMKKTVCLILFLITRSGFAALHDLVDDFYARSIQLKQAQSEEEKAKQGLKAFKSQTDWRLQAGVNRRDSYPPALVSFQSQRTIDDTLNYSLLRPTTWGGEFSVSQEIISRDLSNWTNSSFFNLPSTSPFEIRNTVSYTQDLARDFFGLQYDLNLEQQKKSAELSGIAKTFEEENQLYNLFSIYITAKYNKALVTLNREAVERAKVRLKTVKKRVRDGLSLKVDLYLAEKALLAQQEQSNQAETTLIDSLERINQIISKEISGDVIIPYSLDHTLKPQLKEIDSIDNLELKMALKNLEISRLAFRSIDRNLYPDISFNYSLSNSAIRADFSDSFSDARFGEKFKTESYGISLSIPLGFNKEEADLAIQKAEMSFQKHKSEMLKKRIVNSINFMKRKYKVLKKNLASGRQRVRLAKLALKEQNRLYSLGKVDIDTVIRTEEDLINTQMSLISYLMNVEMTMASISKFSGYFSDLFVEYRD